MSAFHSAHYKVINGLTNIFIIIVECTDGIVTRLVDAIDKQELFGGFRMSAELSSLTARQICDQVKVAVQAFTAALSALKTDGLREALTSELQGMEASEIKEGRTETAARTSSWKRVKMLHGLGYPVDFDWLLRSL
ncbi:hypothetical protein [Methylobacterium sp. GC_Met_2]|uniref:hypothetical protein n=1 Tax=Methylobacterium sp. GC_Met_2 TaxID=2937376 RepID=UPI00226B26E9|nr:hypothetical protein [Methylobacterium sp. GC_Met_2]